ncbi:MAG TPA: phage tail tip lysozyme [Caulobacteraceae bacterium]|jgi:hypothetical protein|nr:phage tail tip lysozyme [Caulobacteraceae bacterium]
MARKFELEITAKDRTEAVVKQIESNFAKLTKGTPFEEAHKRLGALGEKREAFGGLINSFRAMGDNSRVAAGGVAEVGVAAEGVAATGGAIETTGAAFAGLGAAAGPVGLAVGVVALTLAKAAENGKKAAEQYANFGTAISAEAAILGQNVEVLQKHQLAGEHAGVSAEGMTQAFEGVGKTLEDALAGRGSRDALALISRLGIHVHRLQNGSIDTADAMNQLGNAMQGQNAQAREQIASTFGASSALAWLIQKQDEREEQLDEASKSGAIKSARQIAEEKRLHESIIKLDDAWHGFQNRMAEQVDIPVFQAMFDFANWLAGLLGGKHQAASAPAGAPSTGSAAGASGGRRTAGGVDSPAAHQAMDYFKSKGWSEAQAAGIVANLGAESGFDPHAVGDHGRALGIGQWHADRQAEFARWAGHSLGMASMREQLDFVQYELTEGARRAAGARLASTSAAGDAGAVVSRFYESPADAQGEASRRGAAAEHLVHVEITHAPGLQVAARSDSAKVTTTARVANSMPGGSA